MLRCSKSGSGGKAETVSSLDRARAWLVTGPIGRGAAFALDFAVAIRTALGSRVR